MGASESLRALDRRVLPAERVRKSPEAWRKAASRWWVLLVVAGLYVIAIVVMVALMENPVPRVLALAGLLPWTVFFGYFAGQQKAEDDRLKGRDPLAKRRPPGV
jgi:hypothetical protein